MKANDKPRQSIRAIENWLANQFDAPVRQLAPISGGFWSSAYGFEVKDKELVLRIGHSPKGYEIDQLAMAFSREALPVPHVLEIGVIETGVLEIEVPENGTLAKSGIPKTTLLEPGEIQPLFYAISERHKGQFIETRPASQSSEVSTLLASLLTALRTVQSGSSQNVIWYDTRSTSNWHDWLTNSLEDSPNSHQAGWRATLAGMPAYNTLFQRCEKEIQQLLAYCPERRDLVHGDLLHQNVLVSDDATCVNAVFSWKCSAFGDFLYDLAWCTLWSPWHPCIDTDHVIDLTLTATDLSPDDLIEAPRRHQCYELQIAASHFAWYVWTGDNENLAQLADITEGILQRGPIQPASL